MQYKKQSKIQPVNGAKSFSKCLKRLVWISKSDVKIDPKWGVWGLILGGRGGHLGSILEVWGGSGSQVRLGRRLGRLLDDFKSQDSSNLRPKMAPSWSPNGIKFDAKIESFFDAFENQIVMRF